MEWVVTYKIIEQDYDNWGVAEFFRGSEEECKRIGQHFAGGEHDLVKTIPWTVVVGPAAEWDQFLDNAL